MNRKIGQKILLSGIVVSLLFITGITFCSSAAEDNHPRYHHQHSGFRTS